MKITEVIAGLVKVMEAHGDLEVTVFEDNQYGDCCAEIADITEYDGTAAIHLDEAEIVPAE